MWLTNATLRRPYLEQNLRFTELDDCSARQCAADRRNGSSGRNGRNGRNCRQSRHFRSPSRLLHHPTLSIPIGYTVS
jgi:hypothetical protein